MSPARLTSYNIVMPRSPEPSEGAREGSLGPGWSWVAFFRPWAAGRPSPRYRWTLFGSVDQAIDDLLRCLDDGNVSERGALCSSVLRTRRAPRELVPMRRRELGVCRPRGPQRRARDGRR